MFKSRHKIADVRILLNHNLFIMARKQAKKPAVVRPWQDRVIGDAKYGEIYKVDQVTGKKRRAPMKEFQTSLNNAGEKGRRRGNY